MTFIKTGGAEFDLHRLYTTKALNATLVPIGGP